MLLSNLAQSPRELFRLRHVRGVFAHAAAAAATWLGYGKLSLVQLFFLYVVLPDLPCGFCFIFVGAARHVRELCEMLTRLACLISRDMHHKSDDHE